MNIAVASRINPKRAEEIKAIVPDADVFILPNTAALDEHLETVEVVFGMMSPAQIERAPRLRWVQLTSSGFEPYLNLKDSAVLITTARSVTSKAGAEYVLAMMLYFTRQTSFFLERQRENIWQRDIERVGSLAGKTLGIIGFGANGKALAKRAKAFEMRVVAVKRTASGAPDFVDELWTIERLNDLLAESDYVAVMIPMTPETRNLIDAERLSHFKRGSYLCNVSRGGIVDEAALISALQNEMLAGAALDVFEEEPLPRENLLWTMPNVVVTPHLGAAWSGMWDAAFNLFCENLRLFAADKSLINLAKFERGY